MDRRSFLKGLGAAVAAFTAAKAAAPAIAKPVRPGVVIPLTTAITADTSKFRKALGDAAAEVEKYLKQCRVVQIDREESLSGRKTVAVTYRTATKNAPRTSLDDEAALAMRAGALLSVQVSTTSDVDIIELDGGYTTFSLPTERQQYEIEATWLIPS